MFSLRISHSTISGFNAKGKNTTTATTHLQKARLIGVMLSLRPRAMIKLPDQRAVAPMAKKYPKIICRFCSRFINLGIFDFYHAKSNDDDRCDRTSTDLVKTINYKICN